MSSLKECIKKINEFRDKRDWRQFHTPKNMAAAMVVEAGEVLEHFQWLTDEQSLSLATEKKREVELELADVATYLLYLCEDLGIDLESAILSKVEINEKKYPVEKSRGKATKYTKL